MQRKTTTSPPPPPPARASPLPLHRGSGRQCIYITFLHLWAGNASNQILVSCILSDTAGPARAGTLLPRCSNRGFAASQHVHIKPLSILVDLCVQSVLALALKSARKNAELVTLLVCLGDDGFRQEPSQQQPTPAKLLSKFSGEATSRATTPPCR